MARQGRVPAGSSLVDHEFHCLASLVLEWARQAPRRAPAGAGGAGAVWSSIGVDGASPCCAVIAREFRRWRNDLVRFQAIGDSPLMMMALWRRGSG